MSAIEACMRLRTLVVELCRTRDESKCEAGRLNELIDHKLMQTTEMIQPTQMRDAETMTTTGDDDINNPVHLEVMAHKIQEKTQLEKELNRCLDELSVVRVELVKQTQKLQEVTKERDVFEKEMMKMEMLLNAHCEGSKKLVTQMKELVEEVEGRVWKTTQELEVLKKKLQVHQEMRTDWENTKKEWQERERKAMERIQKMEVLREQEMNQKKQLQAEIEMLRKRVGELEQQISFERQMSRTREAEANEVITQFSRLNGVHIVQ